MGASRIHIVDNILTVTEIQLVGSSWTNLSRTILFMESGTAADRCRGDLRAPGGRIRAGGFFFLNQEVKLRLMVDDD